MCSIRQTVRSASFYPLTGLYVVYVAIAVTATRGLITWGTALVLSACVLLAVMLITVRLESRRDRRMIAKAIETLGNEIKQLETEVQHLETLLAENDIALPPKRRRGRR